MEIARQENVNFNFFFIIALMPPLVFFYYNRPFERCQDGNKKRQKIICFHSFRLALTFYVGCRIIQDMENLILIGMPSSGKSTAGVLLAKKIGYGFIDCDLLIQGQEHALLSEIIEKKGTEGFIEVEERVNAGLYADRCVIATGGSVIYGVRAMEHLKTLGKIVYLRLSAEEVERRIGNFVRRGVVMRGGIRTLRELYFERVPLYEHYAHYTVDCDGQTVEGTAEAIASAVGIRL